MVTSNYWKDVTFNVCKVDTTFKPCLEKNFPYDDYETVHKILTGPMTTLRNSKELLGKMRFAFKHVDRKSNELIYLKCVDPRCEYCTSNPNKAVDAWKYLKEREFKWPNQEPLTSHTGHFQTFMEVERIDKDFISTGDTGLPCTINVGKCPYCPSYIFMSDTEKRRHMSVSHSDKRKTVAKSGRKSIDVYSLKRQKKVDQLDAI